MPSLVNIKGPDMGACYPIGDAHLISVGRDEKCDIQIRDVRVSRQHLQLTNENGAHTVADYRTANGTLLNGADVTEKTPLKDGDQIRIGDTTLVYTTDDYPDAATAVTEAKKKGEWKRSTIM